MFGLFDRPSLKIAKNVPSWTRPVVEEVEHVIGSDAVNYGFTKTNFELAKGVALAAWVLNEHRCERVDLSSSLGNYISNMGKNCSRMLGTDSSLAISLVKQLENDGVIEVQ